MFHHFISSYNYFCENHNKSCKNNLHVSIKQEFYQIHAEKCAQKQVCFL